MHAILYRILWLDSDSWHHAQFDLSAVTKRISQREKDLSCVPFRQFLKSGKEEIDLTLFPDVSGREYTPEFFVLFLVGFIFFLPKRFH